MSKSKSCVCFFSCCSLALQSDSFSERKTVKGRSGDVDVTFIFNVQKQKNMIVKWELSPGHKQLHYAANANIVSLQDLHIQHVNTKLAKNPEGHYS